MENLPRITEGSQGIVRNGYIVKHLVKPQLARVAGRILYLRKGKRLLDVVALSFYHFFVLALLIVGRSDTCDIYIDDTKLSRQHFVIENDNGTFYVMDLQSRNGTMLNGIRINSRQRLSSGDKIMAGLSDIIITILGR